MASIYTSYIQLALQSVLLNAILMYFKNTPVILYSLITYIGVLTVFGIIYWIILENTEDVITKLDIQQPSVEWQVDYIINSPDYNIVNIINNIMWIYRISLCYLLSIFAYLYNKFKKINIETPHPIKFNVDIYKPTTPLELWEYMKSKPFNTNNTIDYLFGVIVEWCFCILTVPLEPLFLGMDIVVVLNYLYDLIWPLKQKLKQVHYVTQKKVNIKFAKTKNKMLILTMKYIVKSLYKVNINTKLFKIGYYNYLLNYGIIYSFSYKQGSEQIKKDIFLQLYLKTSCDITDKNFVETILDNVKNDINTAIKKAKLCAKSLLAGEFTPHTCDICYNTINRTHVYCFICTLIMCNGCYENLLKQCLNSNNDLLCPMCKGRYRQFKYTLD